ncbi:MAG: hypothetical protein AVDCRST_MAG02-4087, partial [uncultured Rubrobacteraceae bacterium]
WKRRLRAASPYTSDRERGGRCVCPGGGSSPAWWAAIRPAGPTRSSRSRWGRAAARGLTSSTARTSASASWRAGSGSWSRAKRSRPAWALWSTCRKGTCTPSRTRGRRPAGCWRSRRLAGPTRASWERWANPSPRTDPHWRRNRLTSRGSPPRGPGTAWRWYRPSPGGRRGSTRRARTNQSKEGKAD